MAESRGQAPISRLGYLCHGNPSCFDFKGRSPSSWVGIINAVSIPADFIIFFNQWPMANGYGFHWIVWFSYGNKQVWMVWLEQNSWPLLICFEGLNWAQLGMWSKCWVKIWIGEPLLLDMVKPGIVNTISLLWYCLKLRSNAARSDHLSAWIKLLAWQTCVWASGKKALHCSEG